MKAHKLISILSQYDPDTEVSVSFADDESQPPHVTSCGNQQPRCYQQLVELAPEGLIVLNHHHQISYMNPKALNILGQSQEVLFFESISNVVAIPYQSKLIETLELLNEVQHASLDISLLDAKQVTLPTSISITNIPSSNGQYRGAIITLNADAISSHPVQAEGDQQHDQLDKKVELIPDYIQQMNNRQTSLLKEKARLEKQECIDATPYWHQEKYLYLIHPKKNGKRERVYIGKKEEKIAEALAAIKRGQRYQDLCSELEDINQNLRTATFKLDSFLWELAKVPPDFHQDIK